MGLAPELARNAVFSAAAGSWLVSIAWSIADARSRLPKARQVRAAVGLVAILPVAGILLWLALRPQETLTERWTRELRLLLFQEVAESQECPVCETALDPEFHACPGCGIDLQQPCEACGEPVPAFRTECRSCGTVAAAEPPQALRSAAG